jgi:Icc-related predicted phosphoesterase
MPDSIPQAEKVTWIIGDIHGMYDPLRALINHLDNEYLDKFIFTGDLIDHGPSSKAVLDLIIDLGDKAITLLGNHEYLLLETLYSEEFRNQ